VGKLYCHIGMPKAGSKAIQHFSVNNKDALGTLGITYARNAERGVWHRKLFTEYDDAMDDMIAATIANSDVVVLSFERAYLVPKLIIARLASLASEMHVFFVVREPVSWLNSWINQIAKAHRSTYEQFLTHSRDAGAVRETLVIDEQLARWEQFTDRSRITAVEYAAHDNVIVPYMDWLGIPAEARDGLTFGNDDPNKALDESSLRVFLEVKRRVGRANRIALAQIMQRAHEALQRIEPMQSDPFRLVNDAFAAEIVDTYQPRFDKVMSRYGAPDVATRFAQTRQSLLTRRVLKDFTPSQSEIALAEEIIAGK